jgi:[glutamine synthetase] adenylyltransferase / [glutamine synthetase]-adenylyl-L-tyrosine phosphorylase
MSEKYQFIDIILHPPYNQPNLSEGKPGMVEQMIIDHILEEDSARIPGAVDLPCALEQQGFSDGRAAARSLARLTTGKRRRQAFAAFAVHLFAALSEAGDPDRVLATFERFLQSAHTAAGGDGQPELVLYDFLAAQPRAVEMLVRIFSGSQFLAEILLRNPEYIENLLDRRQLAKVKSRERFYAEARAAVAGQDTAADQLDALRRYQRGDMLRIGACDLLGLYDLPAVTLQLSNLADSLVQVCLEIAAAQVAATLPEGETGGQRGFAVIGMGKLGGRELNYSSDIDFIFLADPASTAATRLGERLIDGLARVTTEGFLYRVDMRLRPWGKVGPLVSSPDGFIAYLKKHALLWEKQALLKARVVAGDPEVGEDFIRRVRPLLFDDPVEAIRADVFAMKQRTEAFVQQKTRGASDVKLGEGSIRDVEFVLQFLQLSNGARLPDLLSANTLDGLTRCLNARLLSFGEYRVLSDGYIFLRTIEHHLQMMDYRQTHTLPDDAHAIASLARRLGFEGPEGGGQTSGSQVAIGHGAGEKFLLRYQQHATAIREIYLRYIGRIEMRRPDRTRLQPGSMPGKDVSGEPSRTVETFAQVVDTHRARMNPSYAERFNAEEIARHAELAGQLDADHLSVVDCQELPNGDWQVAVIAVDFPGELSLICGLMYVYGLDIQTGAAFTYELPGDDAGHQERKTDRKIVDVFTVRAVRSSKPWAETWPQYAQDLEELLHMMRAGQRREARGMLAKRVGAALFEAGQAASQGASPDAANALFPIQIQIDNKSSDRYTVLHIDTPDTVGFLYEFTTALTINRIYIAQVLVSSAGNQVRDTLFVTDENGQKITNPDRQRELRAATVLIKHFTHLLPYSPNPESALLHFPEFISQLFKRANWPDELGSLERPEVLQAMARLLGVSDFLWDDFLRMQYVNLYPVVTDMDALATAKTRTELQAELEAILAEVHAGPQPPTEDAPWQEALNAFKDREMFRIDMRHILGHTREFWDFAVELTDLAEVVVNAAYHLCHEDLRVIYGTPCLEDAADASVDNERGNLNVSEMSVCALGKCGGRELGFASDIELMFIYSGNGKTSGPQVISSTEFYEKLVQNFVRTIRARREGVFEIDLQLRPYGKAGSLSVSLDAFRRYFAANGPAWAYERQALVKLRPIAGNPGLGKKITELRDAFIYTGERFDATAMRAMRERQVRHLVTGGMFNLKYSPGGLVDIEYLVQGLQMTYGREIEALRQTNTRDAMAALAAANLLSQDDYTRLRKAHTFLRWLIDSLRVVRGNARDVTVPQEGSEEFAFLARRLLYGNDTERLRDELIRYTADVQEINKRLLG